MRTELRMEPRLEAIDGVVVALRDAARPRLGEAGAAGLEAAVAEALANVVLHACAGLGCEAVAVTLEPETAGVRVAIEDRGRPAPPDLYDAAPALAEIDPFADGGRGRAIVRHFAASVAYRPGAAGNRLVLTFAPAGAPKEA